MNKDTYIRAIVRARAFAETSDHPNASIAQTQAAVRDLLLIVERMARNEESESERDLLIVLLEVACDSANG